MTGVARIVAEIAAVVVLAISIIATLMFLGADSSAEATARNVAALPAHCEAGYLNHGTYVCWLTIHDHPVLFALSITGVFASGFIIARMHGAKRRENDDA